VQAEAAEGTSGMGTPSLHVAISRALAAAEASGLVLGNFDLDKDGFMDMFTIVHR
jgi:hypothetical protein